MSDILRTKAMLLQTELSRWERMVLVYLGDLATDDGAITGKDLDCVAAISGATPEHVNLICGSLEQLGLVKLIGCRAMQLSLD